MKRFWTDVAWVGVYELGEAVRTRLFQLVLLAYAGGIGVSSWLLVEILHQLETSAAAAMGVPATDKPGAMASTLLGNGELKDLLEPIVGGGQVDALLSRPILALWTGAAAMALLPLVLLFSSSGSIATEVRSRSIRYLLCRTGRLQIGLGKLFGQLLLALVAAIIGGAVAWTMGMTMMVGNPPVALALELANRTLRACAYALPFAGLGLAASQIVASPNGARFLAAAAMVAMPIVAWQLDEHVGPDLLGRLADLAGLFVATTTWQDLWSTDAATLQIAVARCVGLAVIYYAAGHAVFVRKDL